MSMDFKTRAALEQILDYIEFSEEKDYESSSEKTTRDARLPARQARSRLA